MSDLISYDDVIDALDALELLRVADALADPSRRLGLRAVERGGAGRERDAGFGRAMAGAAAVAMRVAARLGMAAHPGRHPAQLGARDGREHVVLDLPGHVAREPVARQPAREGERAGVEVEVGTHAPALVARERRQIGRAHV